MKSMRRACENHVNLIYYVKHPLKLKYICGTKNDKEFNTVKYAVKILTENVI